MKLYDKPIKGINRLPLEDLRQIARFNRIVLNYKKMCEIEKRHNNAETQRLTDIRAHG